jgi:quinol monooxygenase YgiN
MLAVHVNIQVKPECVDAFIRASEENAQHSLKEPGIARFDVVQDRDDSGHFMLVEVYKTAEAPAAHKETAHYAKWRDTVADMMAVPRSSTKFETLYPEDSRWES